MLNSVLKGLVLCGKLLLKYGMNRAVERSTWQGAIAIASAAGVSISPEATNQIISAGVAAAGIVHAVFPEQTNTKTEG